MRLSIQMFADWLASYDPKTDIKSNQFEIETVRLFSGNTVLNKNTLYIGRLSDFFKNGTPQVICTHNNDMIILNTEELEEVLDDALDALEFYSNWNGKMMDLLTSGAMLQELFDASENLFRNPAFLVDSGQRLLAYTTKYGMGQVDLPWDDMLRTGSMDLHFLIQMNQKYPEVMAREGMQHFDIDMFDHQSLVYNFYFKKNWTGSAVLIDKEHTFTAGERDGFQLFCESIGKWFEIHIEEQQASIIDTLLYAAITDSEADTKELRRKLQLSGWKETDDLLFVKLDAPYQPFNINRHLCRMLNVQMRDIYAITNELSVCLLCNFSQLSSSPWERQLEEVLQSSKYYGVKGRTFTMQESFYQHYRYAESVSRYCEKKTGHIYSGEQYVMQYVLEEMQQNVLPDILHPALKQLEAYDEKHHTQFYHTLYVYLKNERSPVSTAAELGLHRNSFAYRLKRLEELLDVNLDDELTRLHLLISYKINFCRF